MDENRFLFPFVSFSLVVFFDLHPQLIFLSLLLASFSFVSLRFRFLFLLFLVYGSGEQIVVEEVVYFYYHTS